MKFDFRTILVSALMSPAIFAVENNLPARVLTATEAQALPSKPGVMQPAVTGTPEFKTAAHVSLSAYGQLDITKVARANGGLSTVYAGLAAPGGAPQQAPAPAPPVPTGSQTYDFKLAGNSVQGWAAMSGTGVPYLRVSGHGRFTGQADASWRTSLGLPNGPNWKVYVKFAVPPVSVSGTFEQDGPSKYRSRAVAELMLNGHPMWNTEAVRFNSALLTPESSGSCQVISEQARHLRQFGAGLTFPGMVTEATWPGMPGRLDEIRASGYPSSSTVKEVTLYVGTFAPGQPIDIEFALRAEASVEGRCCKKKNLNTGKDELFCSGAEASVDYNTQHMPVFYLEPVL